MAAALTFDIEERFHSHLTPADCPREWRMHERISRLLECLGDHGCRATFFVVGELAEQYPERVVDMVQNGHEVASHSHSHIKMDRANAGRCMDEVRRSKETLEDITGEPVYGYRAPSWSADLSDDWLWDHLVEMGFTYDSSLFPFRTNMYGSFRVPVTPFRLHPELIEIPASVSKWGGIRVPYGGGFYFRLYPSWLTQRFIARDIRGGRIPVLYFHPWDFEVAEERYEATAMNRLIGNINTASAWAKFTGLVANLSTMTLSGYIARYNLARSRLLPSV